MKTLGFCLICLFLITAECIAFAGEVVFDQSRITFTPVTTEKMETDSTGKTPKTVVFFASGGTVSEPCRGRHIIGHLLKLTPTDTVLYVFGTSSPEDSTLVESLVSTLHPREWNKIRWQKKEKLSRLFGWEGFKAISINAKDGNFHLVINERSNPKMNKWLTIFDAEGKILARCHGWEE